MELESKASKRCSTHKTKFDVIQALSGPGATQLSLADKFGVARYSVAKI